MWLRGVIRVDRDVLPGQVAAEPRGLEVARVEIDGERDVRAGHRGFEVLFDVRREMNRHLVAVHDGVADAQDQLPRVERDRDAVVASCFTDGHGESAPVRVAAVYRGLDQRRLGHRPADRVGVLFVGRVGDMHGKDFGGAFAVADDLLGEVVAEFGEFAGERFELFVGVDSHPGITIGQQVHGVAGAGVGVHADSAEASAGGVLQRGLGLTGRELHVGRDERQHGGKAGARCEGRGNHAAAFGDAAERVARVGSQRGGLGDEVGGEDRGRGVGVGLCAGGELLRDRRDARGDFLDGQRTADDAGAGGQDGRGFASQRVRGRLTHRQGVGVALRSGRDIGISAVADDAPEGFAAAFLQMLSAELDRSADDRVAREHARGHTRCSGVADDQAQIRPTRFLDPAGAAGGPKTTGKSDRA